MLPFDFKLTNHVVAGLGSTGVSIGLLHDEASGAVVFELALCEMAIDDDVLGPSGKWEDESDIGAIFSESMLGNMVATFHFIACTMP